ncbi:CoaE-domain-containing protein [Wallemia mellicola CBS 633.66]|uniref:CoaE-domain-containing protein n=1 Tax=Wallemia mellicola (strain ATCC MYA-4683 / CBS 633.66) TaxID=671144 RepID=I4Y7U3_WALMC|nr:CoaE-domain-containing protein [Wallemia mellicola CBS 633.66]EIM20035.1 CoaE-domain-containing protein [Wallemia mellicola CBS 633.66]|eukprot:XP_006959964.1 CoaE-domain-containing protein [Wallemia mellicola CBS 633.66]
MLVVGLTGGISTGKSTVSQRLQNEHKIKVIDMDLVARQVVEPGTPALHKIVERYGERVLKWDPHTKKNVLDRPALGRILFADKSEKKWIEGVLHPVILKKTAWEVLKAYITLTRVVVLDVPLLFEASLHKYIGISTLVYCPPSVQLERLMIRDGITHEEAANKVKSQIPIDEKLQLSDEIIYNDKTKQDTFTRIDEVVEGWYRRTSWWYIAQWVCPPLAAIQAAWIIYSRRQRVVKVNKSK